MYCIYHNKTGFSIFLLTVKSWPTYKSNWPLFSVKHCLMWSSRVIFLAFRQMTTFDMCFSCYGCLSATVNHCITLLRALSTQSFSKFGEDRLIRELVASNLNSGPLSLRRDAMLLLCTLTKGNLQATTLLHEMLYERITEAMEFCTTATSLVCRFNY